MRIVRLDPVVWLAGMIVLIGVASVRADEDCYEEGAHIEQWHDLDDAGPIEGDGCGGAGQLCCVDAGSIDDCCESDPFCVPFSCSSCDCDSGLVNVAGICCDPTCDPGCGGDLCASGCLTACNPVTCPGNAVCNASCNPAIPPACNPVCGGDACGAGCPDECSIITCPANALCDASCHPLDPPHCNPVCGGDLCASGCTDRCNPAVCPDNAFCNLDCNPATLPACNPVCPGGDVCNAACDAVCNPLCQQYDACECDPCSLACDPFAATCDSSCGGNPCDPICPSYTADCESHCGGEGQGPCFCLFDDVLCCNSGLGQDPPVVGECSECYVDNPGYMCNGDGYGGLGELPWIPLSAEDLRTGPGWVCDRGLIWNPATNRCEDEDRYQEDVSNFTDSWAHLALRHQRRLQQTMPLTQCQFLGTHNSYNNGPDDYTAYQSSYSMSDQHHMGLRFFMIDVHYVNGDLRLCHGNSDSQGCSPFDRPWRHAAEEILDRVQTLPSGDEIIFIDVENATSDLAEIQEFFPPCEDYFGDKLFRPSDLAAAPFYGDWSKVTPAAIRATGKHMIFVGRNGAWPDFQDVVHTDNYSNVPGWPGNGVVDFEAGFMQDPYEISQYEGDTLEFCVSEDSCHDGLEDIGLFSPSVVKDMIDAGVNQLGIDPLGTSIAGSWPVTEEFEPLMEAAVWSWAEGQPTVGIDLAARLQVDGTDGKFYATNKNVMRRFACRSDTGNCWTISEMVGPFDMGAQACAAMGDWYRHFDVPGNGYEMQQLIDVVMAELGPGASVWVNYHSDLNTWEGTPRGQHKPGNFPAEFARYNLNVPSSVFAGPPDGHYQGIGGDQMTFDLREARVTDREGADFNVYEVALGGPEFELIDVLVSANGVAFYSVKPSEATGVNIDGDGGQGAGSFARSYDLASVGLAEARYIRIRGLASGFAGGNNGFDLDAIGVIRPRLARCGEIGDMTRNGVVDLEDHEALVECLAGPAMAPAPPTTSSALGEVDPFGLHGDGYPVTAAGGCGGNNQPCCFDIGGPNDCCEEIFGVCVPYSCGDGSCDCDAGLVNVGGFCCDSVCNPLCGGDPCDPQCHPSPECDPACGGDPCSGEYCGGYEICHCEHGSDPTHPACGGGAALTLIDCLAAFDSDRDGDVDLSDLAVIVNRRE